MPYDMLSQQILLKRIQKLIDVGISLSLQRDSEHLLEMILVGAKELTHSDGGTLYTLTPDQFLHFEIVITDSLNLHFMAKATAMAVPFPDIPLYDISGNPNDNKIVSYAVLHNCTVNVADAYETEGFDFSGTKEFDQKVGYRSKSFLTVPLRNNENDIIGVLQLINAQNPETKEIIPFSSEDQQLVEALASQAAIAMTNQRLIHELRFMFESLTNVIADAIDEKSPITGRHCRRVPVIALMLAAAVNDTKEGPLKGIHFSQAELYELNIAALLHDCGKVTTPVHIVEKSKKLEGIIDRIQLVDNRCEIKKRDFEIEVLKNKLSLLKQHEPELFFRYQNEFSQMDRTEKLQREELEADRKFLHECNLGKEVMPEGWKERIAELAEKYVWAGSEDQKQPFLTEDELKNLAIPKGNLTEEERLIIQNHVVMTIRMLNEIPYPKYLKQVPEIAGKHHERIDGQGYPNQLTGDQMSIRARILAIADVFEALTAPDRPYKDILPLSVALKILRNMKDEGHIDPWIYDVFMKEKVYLRYGMIYLSKKQIDVE